MLLLCVFAALFLLSKAVHPMGERPFFAFPRNCIFRTISVAYSSIIYLYLPFPALSRIISLDKRFAPNRKKATVTKCALTEICIAPPFLRLLHELFVWTTFLSLLRRNPSGLTRGVRCRKQIPPLPLKIHLPFDTISKTASAKGREFHVQSQLEAFLHAADAGSFNKAAAERCITPTAVIKQINLLEESLGVKLFDRSTAC